MPAARAFKATDIPLYNASGSRNGPLGTEAESDEFKTFHPVAHSIADTLYELFNRELASSDKHHGRRAPRFGKYRVWVPSAQGTGARASSRKHFHLAL